MTRWLARMPRPFTVGELVTLLQAYRNDMPVLLEGDGNQIVGVTKQSSELGERVVLETTTSRSGWVTVPGTDLSRTAPALKGAPGARESRLRPGPDCQRIVRMLRRQPCWSLIAGTDPRSNKTLQADGDLQATAKLVAVAGPKAPVPDKSVAPISAVEPAPVFVGRLNNASAFP
jgi:hypothetical protein